MRRTELDVGYLLGGAFVVLVLLLLYLLNRGRSSNPTTDTPEPEADSPGLWDRFSSWLWGDPSGLGIDEQGYFPDESPA